MANDREAAIPATSPRTDYRTVDAIAARGWDERRVRLADSSDGDGWWGTGSRRRYLAVRERRSLGLTGPQWERVYSVPAGLSYAITPRSQPQGIMSENAGGESDTARGQIAGPKPTDHKRRLSRTWIRRALQQNVALRPG